MAAPKPCPRTQIGDAAIRSERLYQRDAEDYRRALQEAVAILEVATAAAKWNAIAQPEGRATIAPLMHALLATAHGDVGRRLAEIDRLSAEMHGRPCADNDSLAGRRA